jgi:hypothetical protein
MQPIVFEVEEVKNVQTTEGPYTEVKLRVSDPCWDDNDPKVGNWRGKVFCARHEPFILRIQDKTRFGDFKLGDKLVLKPMPFRGGGGAGDPA